MIRSETSIFSTVALLSQDVFRFAIQFLYHEVSRKPKKETGTTQTTNSAPISMKKYRKVPKEKNTLKLYLRKVKNVHWHTKGNAWKIHKF